MRPAALRPLRALVALASLMVAAQDAGAQAVLRGRLIDSLRTGRPIEGGEIVHVGSGRRVTTDRRGRFEFNGLAAGSHRLAYWAPWLDSVALPAVERTIEIVAGTRTVDIELATPSAARMGQGYCGTSYDAALGILVGEVRTPSGAPIAGAPVEARWTETVLAPGTREKREVSASDVSSESGLFTLCGVPASVAFNLRSGASNAVSELLVDLRGSPIARRDLILADDSSRATVRGRVVGPGGQPLVGAQVILASDGATAVAEADGRFVLRRTPQRSSQLLVRAIGYDPLTVDVDPRGDMVELGDVPMIKSAYSLPQVDVNGVPFSRERLDFEQRRKIGWGRFVSDEELRLVPNVSRAALLYSTVPRSRVVCKGASGCTFMLMGPFGAPCIPALFVDGKPNAVGPQASAEQQFWVERAVRVEVYRSTLVPAQFDTASGDCGALVVWTR